MRSFAQHCGKQQYRTVTVDRQMTLPVPYDDWSRCTSCSESLRKARHGEDRMSRVQAVVRLGKHGVRGHLGRSVRGGKGCRGALRCRDRRGLRGVCPIRSASSPGAGRERPRSCRSRQVWSAPRESVRALPLVREGHHDLIRRQGFSQGAVAAQSERAGCGMVLRAARVISWAYLHGDRRERNQFVGSAERLAAAARLDAFLGEEFQSPCRANASPAGAGGGVGPLPFPVRTCSLPVLIPNLPPLNSASGRRVAGARFARGNRGYRQHPGGDKGDQPVLPAAARPRTVRGW